MSGPGKFEDISHSHIPCREYSDNFPGVQVPNTTAIEGCDMDVQDPKDYSRLSIVEFL